MKQKLRQWLVAAWIDIKLWLTKEVDINAYFYAMVIITATVIFLVILNTIVENWTITEPHDTVETMVATMQTMDIPATALTETPESVQATRTPLPTFEVPNSPTVTNTPLPSPTPKYIVVVQTKIVDPTAVPTKWEPSPAPTWDWSTPWPTMPPKGTPWTPPPQPTYEPTIFATMRTPAPTITPKDPPTLVPTSIPTDIPTDIPTSEPTPSYPNPD